MCSVLPVHKFGRPKSCVLALICHMIWLGHHHVPLNRTLFTWALRITAKKPKPSSSPNLPLAFAFMWTPQLNFPLRCRRCHAIKYQSMNFSTFSGRVRAGSMGAHHYCSVINRGYKTLMLSYDPPRQRSMKENTSNLHIGEPETFSMLYSISRRPCSSWLPHL